MSGRSRSCTRSPTAPMSCAGGSGRLVARACVLSLDTTGRVRARPQPRATRASANRCEINISSVLVTPLVSKRACRVLSELPRSAQRTTASIFMSRSPERGSRGLPLGQSRTLRRETSNSSPSSPHVRPAILRNSETPFVTASGSRSGRSSTSARLGPDPVGALRTTGLFPFSYRAYSRCTGN